MTDGERLGVRDTELIIEALAIAASRPESMGHVTSGRARYLHDEKARRMRDIRQRLKSEQEITGTAS